MKEMGREMNKDMIWAYLLRLGSGITDVRSTFNMEIDYRYDRFSTELNELHTDEKIWRQVTEFLPSQGINTLVIDVGEGMIYESHPELAVKGSWSKDKLKKELDRLRRMGITPIPKLNFSKCHDHWLRDYRYMVNVPEYYQVCEDTIKEVVEVFGTPELIHLGMDDELVELQTTFKAQIQREDALWWHDLYFMFDLCDKLSVRPWVNADAYWRLGKEYLEKMPKSVMQSNWYYGLFSKKEGMPRAEEPYIELDKAGFDQIPTCSSVWYEHNVIATFDNLKPALSPDRLKGYLTTPVIETDSESYYTLADEAYRFSYAKERIYPEYCR